MTIPISAIEPRPESIIVSAMPHNTASSKTDASSASLSAKHASFTSPETSSHVDNNLQTPILVTITMANKSSGLTSSSATSTRKNGTSSGRNRSSSSSSATRRKKSSKHAKNDLSSATTNTNTNTGSNKLGKHKTNASVTCGSMEIPHTHTTNSASASSRSKQAWVMPNRPIHLHLHWKCLI